MYSQKVSSQEESIVQGPEAFASKSLEQNLLLIPNSPYSQKATLAPYSVWRDNFVYICFFSLLAAFGHWKGQEVWSYIHSTYSQRTIIYLFTFAISTCTFWLVVGLMTIVDAFQFATEHRLQPYQRTVHKQIFIKAFNQTLFNQFVVGIPTGCFLIWTWNVIGGGNASLQLPSYSKLLLDVIAIVVCIEIAFYYCHRFLHWHRIYRFIHKRHHEFTSPMAICSIYAHPVEHVLANMFPVFLGPVVGGVHVVVLWIWLVIVTVNTVNSHCGYTIPGFPNPLHHDFHHVKFRNNFGIFGVLDTLHGTNGAYKRFVSQVKSERG